MNLLSMMKPIMMILIQKNIVRHTVIRAPLLMMARNTIISAQEMFGIIGIKRVQ